MEEVMEGTTMDHCRFAIVQATIEKVDDNAVTFSARATTAFGGTDLNLRKTFTVPRSEIYTESISGAPAPVAMTPGATGSLYLSRAGWASATADGFTLFGAHTAIFKWPECAGIATPVLTKLSVIPTSIVVRGHLEGATECFDLELLGPDAEAAQDFTWNSVALIELRLTGDGAQRLCGGSGAGSGDSVVRIWPTAITVTGAPAIDPSLSGSVDILNCEMAGEIQRIAFTEPGAAVTLRLTQDGITAFHVTPELVAERSDGIDAEA
jgi:hypothetical protein